ncbi:hypothetical protein L0657_05945 [Dyadobacter sp. CY345]|uniref:hypothetical protein n=1 Tax=Dyadobacter sp. CY345 TaxID=2909335 RepID=UPI001F352FFF|nr:hypothetical protein [Dyadobacter sp. CY345]MCF2443493.1 hypothetical protein [Dyadobacter sp. CY345]
MTKLHIRRTDDALWKGLLENIFDDFLRFFFPNADEVFDIKKGFTYLDKELSDLFSTEESIAPKHVDKLVKVLTKKGETKWILAHIEVQGQKDKDFSLRMFTYYYRILDRYRVPITAIAVFTDANKSYHINSYETNFMGTVNSFKFNTCKVLDQDEKQLEDDDNPFSIAILTVLLGLKSKRLNDEQLFNLKFRLLRNLYTRNIPKKKIDGLLLFLQLYVRFENKDYKVKFEQVIEELTENKNTMGIREFVLERAKKEGKAEGKEEGLQQGIYLKSLDFTKSLLSETTFDDEKIAAMVGVDVSFVKKVRTEIS